MNVGTTAATGMMMYAGYQGGAAMLPPALGGRGFDAVQAHGAIGSFVEPIAISILLILAGVMAGGAGFISSYQRQKKRQQEPQTSSDSDRGAGTDVGEKSSTSSFGKTVEDCSRFFRLYPQVNIKHQHVVACIQRFWQWLHWSVQ